MELIQFLYQLNLSDFQKVIKKHAEKEEQDLYPILDEKLNKKGLIFLTSPIFYVKIKQ